MKRSRKPYPDEFKQEAVRLLREQRLPRSQVARVLGVSTLRRSAAGHKSYHQTPLVRKTRPLLQPSALPSSPGSAAKTSNCAWNAIS